MLVRPVKATPFSSHEILKHIDILLEVLALDHGQCIINEAEGFLL